MALELIVAPVTALRPAKGSRAKRDLPFNEPSQFRNRSRYDGVSLDRTTRKSSRVPEASMWTARLSLPPKPRTSGAKSAELRIYPAGFCSASVSAK